MEYRILETLEELKSLIKTNHHNKWMNIREVCEYTSVSERTIRRAIKKKVYLKYLTKLANCYLKELM